VAGAQADFQADFQLVFDLHPQPMWVADRETLRFVAVNQAACELYGWTADELLAMRVPDVQPAGDLEGRSARHLTKHGRTIDVDIASRTMTLGGRTVWLAVITDVSGVAEAERRFQLLVERSSDGISTVNAQGVITYMSPGGARILGLKPEDLVGTSALASAHPDDAKRLRAARPGELWVEVQRGRHKDGSWRWIESASANLLDEPAVRAHVSNFRDITERHQAAQNFRTLIERLPTATLVHRDGVVVYANAAAIAIVGAQTADQLLGRSILELVTSEDHEAVLKRIELTATQGTSSINEVRLLRLDGTTIVIEAKGVLLDFDGKPSHVVFANDITERRALFTRIAVADRLLSVGTLAAGVAHEINNPLAYVTANLELIAAEVPKLLAGEPTRLGPTELTTAIADAREGAARVSGIVRDLRTLARPDDKTSSPVDVLEVLALAIKMTHNEIRHRALVVNNYAESLPPVYANASRLGQVFLNLLVNAAHAIEEGHADDNEIRVRVTADAAMVYIEIEDTGAGIPPSVLPRIFDPFFTTKPHGLGVGLGLSICDRIVESFGGTISVTTKVGEGSTFRVALPVAPRVEREVAAPSSKRDRSRSRILMIDDEPAVGRSIRLLLSPDHEVVPVTRAREALDRLHAGERFDLILCDLMMPDISGMEFYAQLTQMCADYKRRVVFMTGGAFTPHARQFLTTVGAPYLEKPFTEEALRSVITAISG
jgi:two-component system, cell cycle sensor histidine kinase and response regulator CckA